MLIYNFCHNNNQQQLVGMAAPRPILYYAITQLKSQPLVSKEKLYINFLLDTPLEFMDGGVIGGGELEKGRERTRWDVRTRLGAKPASFNSVQNVLFTYLQ